MLKHIITLTVLSLLIIVGMPYVQQGLQLILSAHGWLSDLLKEVFSGGEAGNIIRQVIALLAIPVFIALIPTFIYWLVKRTWFPYFMELVWVIWLIQTSALVIMNKAV